MTKAEAIAMLKRIQEPEAWEPQINQAAFEALDMAIKALEQQRCEDTISRQAAIDALTHKWDGMVTSVFNVINSLPPAQSDLIAKIQNGIKATDADDVYSCGMRNGMRWCKSLIDGKEPLYENCPSSQPEKVYLATVMPEPHWTPCSEELPKENGHYLVTFHQTATEEDLGFDMDDTDVRKMRYDTKHGWRTPRRIPSWINDAVVSTVLAWMPLPEPYREGRWEE